MSQKKGGGAGGGKTNERPVTDHMTSGPIRGITKKLHPMAQTPRQTDIWTWRPYDWIGPVGPIQWKGESENLELPSCVEPIFIFIFRFTNTWPHINEVMLQWLQPLVNMEPSCNSAPYLSIRPNLSVLYSRTHCRAVTYGYKLLFPVIWPPADLLPLFTG